MGKRSATPGVEIRNGKLRIWFRVGGELKREPLNLPATPPNLKHAIRLVDEIRTKIKAGAFDYGHYFPDKADGGDTAKQYAARWLAMQGHIAESTRRGYAQTLKSIFGDRLGDMPMRQVTASVLGQAFEEHGWQSVKARNNALTPVRGVCALAVADKVLEDNPADLLKFGKYQREDPDPLTLEEVDLVVTWLREKRGAQAANYFEFAMFSGLRTSELIALEWGDVDWRRGVVRVQRAQVMGNVKILKTAKVRDVELLDRARATLERQKSLTFLAGGRIFLDALTGRPYVGDKPPRLHWDAALKAKGLRARVAYQTRHTFATLALMAGVNPAWIARQLGHANAQMLFRVYSKWIEGADKGKELAKLNAALGEPGEQKATRRGIGGEQNGE